MKSDSRLEKVLTAGKFAVTAELGPPQNANPEAIKKKAQHCLGNVEGANITDNQTAIVRMSSIAAAAIAISCGVEPVVQMVCRDRNRIAMQSDILGAAALGVKNLLCLSGDHQKFGNHPQAANVFDIDSVQLIAMVKRMRDDKQFISGDPIKEHEPRYSSVPSKIRLRTRLNSGWPAWPKKSAPEPISSFSKTTTRAPAFARLRAAERPVKPLPITTTSEV